LLLWPATQRYFKDAFLQTYKRNLSGNGHSMDIHC